ncbi:hypothetical protein M885DRAFT_506424 [Pelagophyceae sp. CCMP2097]|nr:hypothetical protein M885DRAFT_506424 [Pelagophyceae sp. CCMP2097]
MQARPCMTAATFAVWPVTRMHFLYCFTASVACFSTPLAPSMATRRALALFATTAAMPSTLRGWTVTSNVEFRRTPARDDALDSAGPWKTQALRTSLNAPS